MTQQLDMIPLDAAALERIAAQLPKAREVTKPRLPLDGFLERVLEGTGGTLQRERALDDARRFDVGHELVLAERAREDHR